uniref:Transmembrane protein n=1 Tax=Panagrellus redivivus TaxID=6233 RepID=A0A7E4W0X1_PANRE
MEDFIEQLGTWISPSNWSTITFDDLEHPRLVVIYSIYWDVSLFLTSLFFCFMLYMIITKSSKEMSGYKWYLVHQLTWSYLFDAYLSIWKPVPLWPFYIAYSAGVFSGLTEYASVVQLIGLTVVAIGMGFSIYVSMFHRYVQVSPFSKFHAIYEKLKYRIPTYFYFLIVIIGVICVPLVIHLH